VDPNTITPSHEREQPRPSGSWVPLYAGLTTAPTAVAVGVIRAPDMGLDRWPQPKDIGQALTDNARQGHRSPTREDHRPAGAAGVGELPAHRGGGCGLTVGRPRRSRPTVAASRGMTAPRAGLTAPTDAALNDGVEIEAGGLACHKGRGSGCRCHLIEAATDAFCPANQVSPERVSPTVVRLATAVLTSDPLRRQADAVRPTRRHLSIRLVRSISGRDLDGCATPSG
jgi:hypothetical protein